MNDESCPRCAKAIGGAPFCRGCGFAVQTVCSKCSTPAEPGDAFCHKCGAPVAGNGTIAAPTTKAVAKPAWTPGNQAQFERWVRFRSDRARVSACVVTNRIYSSLQFRAFYDALTQAVTQLNAPACRSVYERRHELFSTTFAHSDCTELSRDFQGYAFEGVFQVFAHEVGLALHDIAQHVPATAPLLERMQLSHEQRVRFCEEIASACRREMSNAIAQMSAHLQRARGLSRALIGNDGAKAAAAVRALGALASGNQVGGALMLGSHLMTEANRRESVAHTRAETNDAVAAACRWADEAQAGVLRALGGIHASVEAKLVQIEGLVIRSLVESGIAPKVDWSRVADQHLVDIGHRVRRVYAEWPALKEQFSRLAVDHEMRSLLAA